jgi:hypothetical protein
MDTELFFPEGSTGKELPAKRMRAARFGSAAGSRQWLAFVSGS